MNARSKGRRGQQQARDLLTERDDFYVYLHRKKTNGEVFYVGKGKGGRAWVHESRRNPKWRAINRKHGHTVEIVIFGLQEWAAYEIEVSLIACYGIENLANLTTGGDGSYSVTQETRKKQSIAASRRARKPLTDETKKKIGDANRGLVRTPEFVEMLRVRALGKKRSDEARRKTSESLMGRKMSELSVRKIAAANCRGVFCIEEKITFESQKKAAEWVSLKRNKKASNKVINQAIKGHLNTAYGYTWRYADGVTPKKSRIATND